MNMPERIELPHNIEAEQALLGAILVNNDAFYRVADTLEPKHFYEPLHERIFDLAANLIRNGKTANPVTMKNLGPEKIEGLDLTWQQYLARLCSEATSIINAADYAQTIVEYARRRELMALSSDISARAASHDLENASGSILEEAEERLFELRNISDGKGGFIRLSDALKEAVDLASRAYQRDGHLSGMPTGLIDLDNLMGGMQNSDLIIIAGRPGMGKTALATNIAFNTASDYRGQPQPDGSIETVAGGIVGFFSLEMSSEQLATRLISEQIDIPSSRIRRGDISENEFVKIANAAQKLQSIPLYIEQTGGLSIAQLVSRARRLKRQRGLDLLVIDYLQLVSGSMRTRDGRVQEITEITTKLKALAKELQIPILCLSQLSREVEKRDNKRPQLSDLRDSGSIEQDADVVMFVYREEYYLQNREPREGTDEWFKWEALAKAAENKAEVIIGKQRHGPCGAVKLSFQAAFTKFGNLAREERLPDRRGGVD